MGERPFHQSIKGMSQDKKDTVFTLNQTIYDNLSIINAAPSKNFLHQSKLKAFVDDKKNVA